MLKSSACTKNSASISTFKGKCAVEFPGEAEAGADREKEKDPFSEALENEDTGDIGR